MNDFTRGYMRGYKDAQKEALAQPKEPEQETVAMEGWKLVPIKPTMKMIDALADTNPEHESVWDAVLAVAPLPTRQQAVVLEHLEPVAVVDANDDGYFAEILPDRSVKVGQHLYAEAPQRNPCPTCESLARTVMLDQSSTDAPQRKPLTRDEKLNIGAIHSTPTQFGREFTEEQWLSAIDEIEAKLNEKNT